MRVRTLGIVVIIVALLMLVSCSKEESKENTQSFLAGLNTTMMAGQNTESFDVLDDLFSKNPPGGFKAEMISGTPEALARLVGGSILPYPDEIDTLFGTWTYYPDSTPPWIHTDTLDPDDGFKYIWEYTDSASVDHKAYLLLDSLEFYAGDEDTLPENAHLSLNLDSDEILWMSFSVTYASPDTITDLAFTLEVVDYFQYGLRISSPTSIGGDGFEGSFRLWVIDHQSNDYRIDLLVQVKEDGSGEVALWDSDEWRLEADISEVVETDTVGTDIFEKRDVDGEITHSGNHAADIIGYIWEPEDDDHESEVMIVYPDGTEEPLDTYLEEPTKGLLTFKPW